MSRAASMKKFRDIRNFFRERLASTVDDPKEAKAELRQRFSITDGQWYQLRPQLAVMIEEAKGSNGKLVAEAIPPEPEEAEEESLEIPANLAPAAKAVVNALLAKNHSLAAEIQVKDAEISGHRSQLAIQGRRSSLLKKVVSDLVDAL